MTGADNGREELPRKRLIAACSVAVLSGFLLAGAVHLGDDSPVTGAVFGCWLAGPLVAGAILHTTRLIPYLVVGVLWFATIPIQSALGLLSVGDAANDPSGPTFVTTFTLVALPFTAPLVAAFAFAAGFGVRLVLDRFSGHGVED